MNKDYATEELGVTGGKWVLGDETDAHYDMNLGESGCRIDLGREPVYCGEPGISRQEMRNVMHLIARCKDLYNMVRKVEEDITFDSNFNCYLITEETVNDLKALVAEIRGGGE